jgi:hypothetical protein
MAHLVALDRDCVKGCGRRAVVVLRNERNEVMAHFCQRCGEKARDDLQAEEDARRLRRGDPPVPEPS